MTLATFQVLSSHMLLVATILTSPTQDVSVITVPLKGAYKAKSSFQLSLVDSFMELHECFQNDALYQESLAK